MKLFYSYCHVDKEYRKRLDNFLVSLKDDGKITAWYDGEIVTGDYWDAKIEQNMKESDILLLLVSQDFLSSKACKKEIDFGLNPANKKIVIPIILKECMWKDTKLKEVLAIPKDGLPVTKWSSEDEAWVNVAENIKRVIERFSGKPKKSFIEELNKTEFVNSGKDNILLSDIFVEPEINFAKIDGKSQKVRFSFEKIISSSDRYCLIIGEQNAGKTGLLSHIYIKAANENGYLPLYIDGSGIKKSRNFEEIMIKQIKDQYENFCWEDYQRCSNKILLVDDYIHTISDNFITWSKENFDFIYIAIDSDEQVLFFKDNTIFADFNQIYIQPMNHTSRYELIKKWKELERSNFTTEEQFQNEIESLERNVDSIIIDKNILPNTPFYILTIIQSYETFMPNNFQITSYGHCYYTIIYSQLRSIGLSQSDLDSSFNYFTKFAKYIFDKSEINNWSLTLGEYNNFKENYKNDYIIQDGLLARLEDKTCLLINKTDEKISFSYPFLFYYFLGKELASDKNTQIIENLCHKIYNRDFANILIFTIHHAMDMNILEEIELHCMVSLDQFKPSTLSKNETAFMNGLIKSMPKEIENKKSCEEQRLDIRRHQDVIEEEVSDIEPVTDSSDQRIIEIEKAMKILDVLGQIIKNRVGSLKKNQVKELICELEKLGLRILSFFLNTLRDQDLKDWISERITIIEKQKGHSLSSKELEKVVEQNIEIMGFVIIVGMLQKTYMALTTDKISSIQEEISSTENTVAFDFFNIFFHLNYNGINFTFIERYYKKFDKSQNFWAQGVLSLLVKGYLETHHVDFKERQKLYDLFKFKYRPNTYIK